MTDLSAGEWWELQKAFLAKGREKTVGEIRKFQGAVQHWDDVTILHDRIGDTQKKQTIRHIEDMQKAGYLTAEEALARQTHVMNAETGSELRDLTSDLPNPVDHRTFIQSWDWDNPKHHLPVLLGGIAVSVLFPLITGLMLEVAGIFSTHEGEAIFWPVLAVGVMGFFLNLVFLVIKSS